MVSAPVAVPARRVYGNCEVVLGGGREDFDFYVGALRGLTVEGRSGRAAEEAAPYEASALVRDGDDVAKLPNDRIGCVRICYNMRD